MQTDDKTQQHGSFVVNHLGFFKVVLATVQQL